MGIKKEAGPRTLLPQSCQGVQRMHHFIKQKHDINKEREKKNQINKKKNQINKSTKSCNPLINGWINAAKVCNNNNNKTKQKMIWNFERRQRGTADRWQRSHAKNPLKHPSPSADWTNSTWWSNQLIFFLLFFFCFCLEQSEASATTTWTTLTTTRNERCKMKK